MSVIGQTRPINFVNYPLNSVIGSGGAPRFGMVERDRGVIIESPRLLPQFTDFDSDFLSSDNLGAQGSSSFLTQQGALGQTRIPGNVLSPALPEYLRNSLLSLDTWQAMETEREQEDEIRNLEQQLAMAEADATAQLKAVENEGKLKKWDLIGITGVAITLIAIIYLIHKRWK
jgi:hypothetical protein